ncbi:1-phosphofructokinase family hexose kinase [Ciceribacter azotifigens]|uniref:1-phosphofructokinase family hexose kinase n=1 Tax=Ciceribacter azotifigens TaxID=2069303 RepID=UPI003A862215
MAKILSIALNPAIDIASEAEQIRHTHKTRTHNQQQFPGGGGINVARVIAELGGECDLVYLSGGATGELLESMLKRVRVRHVPIHIKDTVRIAYMVHEASTGLEYRFVPEGPIVSEEEVKPLFDVLEKSDADYFIASGSLPRGVETDIYSRMADIASRKGARFVLDTSGDALKVTLSRSRVFLVKPSVGELEGLVGRRLNHSTAGEAAREIVQSGAAQYVALTMGKDGALLATGDDVMRLPAIKVPVQSAVGAGDSFVAAMTWSLAEGHNIREAFRFGLAAGAAAVMTPGTQLCRRQDVLDLYEAHAARAKAMH